MKEKMNRFCLQHKWLAFFVYSVPLIVLYSALLVLLQGPMWAIIFVDVLIVLGAWAQVSIAPDQLQNDAIVYYNNLADAYFEMQNIEKFEIWYQKSQQILADIKNKKIKEQLRNSTALMPVQAHLGKQEYTEALGLLQTISCDTKRKQVEHAFYTAQAYLGLGEKEKAMGPLKHVIYNGNKLFVVTEAKKLLEKIEFRAD